MGLTLNRPIFLRPLPWGTSINAIHHSEPPFTPWNTWNYSGPSTVKYHHTNGAHLIVIVILPPIVTRSWSRIKSNKGPGELHSHTAIKAYGSMFVFGGENQGKLQGDLWRFHFGTQLWEKITIDAGTIPSPRAKHTAAANPFVQVASMWDSSPMNEFSNAVIGNNRNHNNRILRMNSANLNQIRPSSVLLAPPKSISMCFGAATGSTDTPLHQHLTASKVSLKASFKVKVRRNPMPSFCSGRSATLSDASDEDDDVDDIDNPCRTRRRGGGRNSRRPIDPRHDLLHDDVGGIQTPTDSEISGLSIGTDFPRSTSQVQLRYGLVERSIDLRESHRSLIDTCSERPDH